MVLFEYLSILKVVVLHSINGWRENAWMISKVLETEFAHGVFRENAWVISKVLETEFAHVASSVKMPG